MKDEQLLRAERITPEERERIENYGSDMARKYMRIAWSLQSERKERADDVELLNAKLESLEAENKRINEERLERGREILRLHEKILFFEGAFASERSDS